MKRPWVSEEMKAIMERAGKEFWMGKGDRRSKRGKLWRGTHGKTRATQQKRRTVRRKGEKGG